MKSKEKFKQGSDSHTCQCGNSFNPRVAIEFNNLLVLVFLSDSKKLRYVPRVRGTTEEWLEYVSVT